MASFLKMSWAAILIYHGMPTRAVADYFNDTFYDIECEDDGTCTMRCPVNNSCADFNITSTDFLYPELMNVSNLTTLSVECDAEGSCDGLSIDCGALNVEICSIGCLADDACFEVNVKCDSRSSYHPLSQCFLYTLKSDSAISYSSIDCNFNIDAADGTEAFCGYRCGSESDGCYEDNICLDHGEGTECSCSGLAEACDEIFFETDTTTQSPKGKQDESPFEDIWNRLMEHKLLFFAVSGVVICCLLLLVMGCCHKCKVRKSENMERLITEEIDIPLKEGLLKNDTLNHKKGTMQYNDSAELAHFRMFRESDIGTSLFDKEIVRKENEY